MQEDLEWVRRTYKRLAPSYDRSANRWDFVLKLDRGREWVCRRGHGDVLEVGVGTGLSLAHYDDDVRLVGVDATPEMLQIAARRRSELAKEVDLRLGDAASLEFADASFDTVVFTYSLCTIPDPRKALAEAHRVLRLGGTLLLTEHVRSPNILVRGGQRLLDRLFRLLEADHLLREPLDTVLALGFTIDELERSALGVMERLRATKPLSPG
ncbi:MAG: class I SAM-dependent methyltransferase [Candidatus Dormibacteria bacterium]